ncbi:MAG: RNA chaperone Hfq [Oscillospiraceae bacterium]|nr:RNA chaperone Hfq [Oscillospiraceae bacterium]
MNDKVQNAFLANAIKGHSVTIFLMNGFQLRGEIKHFDEHTVVLYTDGKQQVIYKHAISTIVSDRPIPLYGQEVKS